MKDEKGITLSALALTIIILLVLSSVAIYSGTSTIAYARFNKAKSEFDIIQSKVNSWYQEYKDLSTSQKANYINTHGQSLDECDETALQETIYSAKITFDSNYRFLSEDYMKDNLGLNESYDFLINIPKREVILFGGLSYNGTTYYTAEDFEISNVESNDLSSIQFDLDQGDNTDIVISNLKFLDKKGQEVNVTKFDVQYKKTTDSSWNNVTSSITKFTDVTDGSKVKYKFTTPEITNTNVFKISYDVKILTSDKKIENTDNVIVESNEYVKTGLILHYDGINNTGAGDSNHSATVPTWKDLSGNGNDGTLYNVATTAIQDSGWGDNYLALDGVDDYVSREMTVDGANGTIEIVAKYISGDYIFRSNASGQRTYIWSNDTVKGNPAVYNGFNKGTYSNTDLSSRVLKYYTINNVSSFSTYYNNLKSEEITYTSITNGTFISIGSSQATSASQPAKIQVYALRIYNRALTDEEVEHNYKVDKSRFSIE